MRGLIIILFALILSIDLNAQSDQTAQDSTRALKFSVSVLSFAGQFPSLQGGLYYRLSERKGLDIEGSLLLESQNTNGSLNNNYGFICKLGYLQSFLNPNNFWAFRLYARNTNSIGREEFSRYGGKYFEIFDYNYSRTLAGMTVGWLRHTHHDMCDFQIGISAGYGALFTRGNLPSDATAFRGTFAFLNTDIEDTSGFHPIVYIDFKMLF